MAWVIKDKERHEFATEKAVFLLHATPTDEVKTYVKSHEIFIHFSQSNDFTTFFLSKNEKIWVLILEKLKSNMQKEFLTS